MRLIDADKLNAALVDHIMFLHRSCGKTGVVELTLRTGCKEIESMETIDPQEILLPDEHYRCRRCGKDVVGSGYYCWYCGAHIARGGYFDKKGENTE